MNAPGVSGLILAGGAGSRMGGVDKGMLTLRGRPLVEWVVERLSPQVSELLISGGAAYAHLGLPIVGDATAEADGSRAGPLAGLQAGLAAASQGLVATAPCDAPFVAPDLVARLLDALEGAHADVAVACVGGRVQPVFCLVRRSVRSTLDRYLDSGGRRAGSWYAELQSVQVPFDDQPEAFRNVNTPDELRALQ
jgi:molybdopterin-guanine dinucleotide biosynthesis protein A